ncbi:hypothetical protein BHM03_00017087 [Ensete ventricosum]|nr:hypothetical protein BHM03_00017087 [Ensete ventricosum]
MGLQMDPGAAGCHVGNQHEASWHQAYTSTEFLSALIPSSPYPLIQVRLLDGRPAHPPTPSRRCFGGMAAPDGAGGFTDDGAARAGAGDGRLLERARGRRRRRCQHVRRQCCSGERALTPVSKQNENSNIGSHFIHIYNPCTCRYIIGA